jgi:electron transport complex protein RnfB
MPAAPERVEAILDCLPQTQCARCGHPGCRPYAEAIAAGAPINRCPPGGERTIAALARLLDEPQVALDPALGPPPQPATAVIREAECIGCFKCVRACPVDAILGAPRFMHTVIATECTGCGLCLPPCPVDCIELRPLAEGEAPCWDAARARRRFDARAMRLAAERERATRERELRRAAAAARAARAAVVRAAIERVRARRRAAGGQPGPVGDADDG